MAKAFRRKGSHVVATLSDVEREVVTVLMLQTRDLLAPPAGEHAGRVATSGSPTESFEEMVADLGLEDDSAGRAASAGARDPALDRLIPSANRQDPEVAAEFRRLTEHGLRQRKSENLTASVDAMMRVRARDRLDLDLDQARAFLVALVDVRLLLGERLGLRTDEDADALHGLLGHADGDDSRTVLATYYDFLTWLQESLTQALMR